MTLFWREILMSYKIESCFCERLNINQYLKSVPKEHLIKANIDFKTKLYEEDNKKAVLKIYYSLESDNTPIFLSWVGVVNIDVNDENIKLDDKELIKDDQIKEFIEESISGFSKYFHGNLPSYDRIMGNI